MKFPHTPAPWTLGSNGASTKVVDADGKAVCMVTYRKDHWNGDLLAAAPELLAALQNCVNVLSLALPLFDDESNDNKDSRDEVQSVLDAARAVIAKAKGEIE